MESPGPTPIRRGYFAALVDGEGCIQYGSTPEVSIGQISAGPLYELEAWYGGTVSPHKKTKEEGDRHSFRWRVFGANAVKFLRDCLGHGLTGKREEAALVVYMYEQKLNPVERAQFCVALSALKKYGVYHGA